MFKTLIATLPRRKFWTPNAHYHVNLKAGENTLNLQVNRVLLRSLVQNKGIYNLQGCLQDYVAFMTRENSANDTFAESYHRGFFANLASGKTLLECAAPESMLTTAIHVLKNPYRSNLDHDSASIGAFVQLPLVFLANIQYPLHELEKICLNHMHTTHQSAQLDEYCSVFVRFLHDVYTGEDLRRSAEKAGLELSFDLKKLWANSPDSPTCTEAQLKLDRKVIGGVFSSACYISDSFPSILYLAGKYDHSLEEALVSNANVGGDNCHRGAVLGMIMGLTGKFTIPQKWIDELEDKEAILEEVMAFVKSVNLPQ